MKIIVVSDSHGKPDVLEEIVKCHPDADMFLHCGDIEAESFVYPEYQVVAGNNDVFYDYPNRRIVDVMNHRILIVHGHQYSFSRRLEEMATDAINNQCDIVCYGHTHIAADDNIHGVRLINPGSLRYSRDGRNPSYAVLSFEDAHVNVEFIFLPGVSKKHKFVW